MNATLTARLGLAALVCLAVPAPAQTPDRGALPEKHDSNTLHRIGKSVQYPFRKGGENISKSTRRGARDVQYGTRKNVSNLSIDAHRAAGRDSVARRRNGSRRHNSVITPKGHIKRLDSGQ